MTDYIPEALFDVVLSVFFFSSRRRHTRWNCDWSSDVCSSDLSPEEPLFRSIVAMPSGLQGSSPPSSDRSLAERQQIGRASCRERVLMWGGAEALKQTRDALRCGPVGERRSSSPLALQRTETRT